MSERAWFTKKNDQPFRRQGPSKMTCIGLSRNLKTRISSYSKKHCSTQYHFWNTYKQGYLQFQYLGYKINKTAATADFYSICSIKWGVLIEFMYKSISILLCLSQGLYHQLTKCLGGKGD